MIDLRSDTVTRPSDPMRRAMYEAEVGDDVFGEDPTVRVLEERIAELLGKESALFVPTGVMGNQLAIRSQTAPGDEVIVDRLSHIYNYESGAAAALGGVQLHIVDGPEGIPTADQIVAAIRPGNYWDPTTRLVCLENTVNKAGGRVVGMDVVEEIGEIVRARGLRFHLDGARLWNASVATGLPTHTLAGPFDTVSVCLSKGLGAPVGSVLAGDRNVISRAHRFRKMFGGGMRQIGILAAAGLYALENNLPRLASDHVRARRLAEAITELPGFSVDLDSVQTNIVLFDVEGPAEKYLKELESDSVLMVAFGPRTIRAITHLDISDEDIDTVIGLMRRRYCPSSVTTP
ncbi:MAG: threonine aldolase family protein [Bacteroidota bacterium]